jgi:Domain of unknown function (DUF4148)
MKRQVVTVLIGSLFALPALANNEIDAGNLPKDAVSVKTRAQVGEELAAAQQSGNWMINSKLGTVSRQITAQSTGKSREQVRSELEQAYRGGGAFANAELS